MRVVKTQGCPGRPATAGGRRPGFSLLELLVVLVIIAVASAVVVPRLAGSLSGVSLRSAAKRAAASMRYARSRAAGEKLPWRAVLDFEHKEIRVEPVPVGDAAEAGEKEAKAGARESKRIPLPGGVRLVKASSGELEADAGTFEITFFPSGGSSGGEVVLADERGRRYALDVDFITGSVRLEELEREQP